MSSRQEHIERKAIDNLPDCPGVYLFYGKVGELLYVGKSKTLRTRVRSHFASSDETRLCSQVHRIEVRATSGELGALLLESQLIKELRPIYNVRSRQSRRIIVAWRVEKKDGYAGILLEAVHCIDPLHTAPIMSIFKYKTQAKEYLAAIAKTHRLCPKLLGLERTRGYCFSYHLGQCSGACAGEEAPALYNVRFERAFAERRIKSWPYSGAVLIEEKYADGDEAEVFLVDQWCLLYSFKYSLERYALQVRGTQRFDYDSYKILCRYLLEASHQENVRVLTRRDIDHILRKTELQILSGATSNELETGIGRELVKLVEQVGRSAQRVVRLP